jgi:alpha-N-arabinofuranosidase
MAEFSTNQLSLNTMVHMVTIKLTPTNYLLWRCQFVPLLESQDLLGYLDGSFPVPSAQIRQGTELVPNPSYKK